MQPQTNPASTSIKRLSEPVELLHPRIRAIATMNIHTICYVVEQWHRVYAMIQGVAGFI